MEFEADMDAELEMETVVKLEVAVAGAGVVVISNLEAPLFPLLKCAFQGITPAKCDTAHDLVQAVYVGISR